MPGTYVADWYERTDQALVRLVSDPAWLGRPMTSVCMVEKPTDLQPSHQDALAFVSGAAITRPEELARLVHRAGEAACAGLVIQTHRYIKELPESICRLAVADHLLLFAAAFPASIEDLMLAAFQTIDPTALPKGACQDALAELSGAPSWSAQLAHTLEAAGFSDRARYQAVALCADRQSRAAGQKHLPALWWKTFGTCPAAMLEDALLGVFAYHEEDEPDVGSHGEKLERLADLAGGADYILSEIYPGLEGLYQACTEAGSLLQKQRAGAFPATLHQAADVTLWWTVERLRGSRVFQELLDRYYRPLARSDQLYQTDHCRFLGVFLQCQGQIKAISDQLGIHRNTVRYKIRAIENLIGASLQRPDILAYMVLLFGAGPNHREFEALTRQLWTGAPPSD